MKFKFTTQAYQQQAVANIRKVFTGQPFCDMARYTRDLGIRQKTKQERTGQQSYFDVAYDQDDVGFENARILLDESEILQNIREIQKADNYKVSDSLVKGLGVCSLDVEMETGTGKTYVYIDAIFALNEKYGWSKFIVVVPSIAIREGVNKSFSMMEEHFMQRYHKKARYFIYNSKRLSDLDNFASSSDINVMIINAQAFNARGIDARRIDMVLDEFNSRKPIDVIARTRPILIIDEPQKLGGEATQTSLQKFKPLFSMNFSATHKKQHNLVYRLDAVDAYNKCLVKKIQVKGFEIKNLRGTTQYIYLQDIVLSKDKPPVCKLEMEVKYKNGIKRETKIVKVGENLYYTSNQLEQYKNGYTVSEINPFTNSVTFLNGETLHIGAVVGDTTEETLRRIQIRETILSHFEKEEMLFNKDVKCLSLFFIDEVVKYRDYSQPDEKGVYAKIFEEEYLAAYNKKITLQETPYTKYLKSINVADTHKGYFSIDKKSGRFIDSKDSKETGSDDISAYDLILKNKERLLSFEEPTRFIFSHSALREGWDNPNVFQICALKPGGDSAVAKRQEVGRGLRIAVNFIGDREDLKLCGDKTAFHKVNTLTVVAADAYKEFVADIQKEIKANLGDRPTKASIEYFRGKYVSDGDNFAEVTLDMASDIHSYLKMNGYIDKDDNITEKYRADLANDSLAPIPQGFVPEGFDGQAFAQSVHKLAQSVFDESVLKEMMSDANRTKVENPLNENFEKFKKLWALINHKYAYTVSFDSDELIEKAIDDINEHLFVSELKYVVTSGEQKRRMDENQVSRGESFGRTTVRTERIKADAASSIRYDLIGKIAANTKLTRKTIVKILSGIMPSRFEMFRINPEEFIAKVSQIIEDQKATVLVDHISYNQTDGKYDADIFAVGEKIDVNSAFKAEKCIQDYVVTDGSAEKSVERKFAEDLDVADEVCVYAKLPRTFQIPTPVGNYAPDWAIAFNEGSVKHIYFIAETKGSLQSLELRTVEGAKISCARKLFNEFSTNEVRYHEVTSYEDLLNVMNAID